MRVNLSVSGNNSVALKEFFSTSVSDDQLVIFVLYCLYEASPENVLFCLAVDDFNKHPTQAKFDFIREHFIISKSEKEVNVSSQQKSAIEKDVFGKETCISIKRPLLVGRNIIGSVPMSRARSNAVFHRPASFGVYDAARLEIFKLLERDAFARFVKKGVPKTETFSFRKNIIFHETHKRDYLEFDSEDFKPYNNVIAKFREFCAVMREKGFNLPTGILSITESKYGNGSNAPESTGGDLGW